MDKKIIARSLKEASACIRKVEAESKMLKEKVAKSQEEMNDLQKELDAFKIAMELLLDESSINEVQEKVAVLKTKDLSIVREAMDLDLSKKIAGLGELYEGSDTSLDHTDPVQAFMAILQGTK